MHNTSSPQLTKKQRRSLIALGERRKGRRGKRGKERRGGEGRKRRRGGGRGANVNKPDAHETQDKCVLSL